MANCPKVSAVTPDFMIFAGQVNDSSMVLLIHGLDSSLDISDEARREQVLLVLFVHPEHPEVALKGAIDVSLCILA